MQLHDVTGKVQSARLRIAALVRELRVAVLELHYLKKQIYRSGPRFRVNRIPWAGVKDPLSRAQETTS